MNTPMLPPAPPAPVELRYDLSPVEGLDYLSWTGLLALSARWQSRNSAARVERLRRDPTAYFGRAVIFRLARPGDRS